MTITFLNLKAKHGHSTSYAQSKDQSRSVGTELQVEITVKKSRSSKLGAKMTGNEMPPEQISKLKREISKAIEGFAITDFKQLHDRTLIASHVTAETVAGLTIDYLSARGLLGAVPEPIEGLAEAIAFINHQYENERSDFINTASPMFLLFLQAASRSQQLTNGGGE